MLYIMLCIYTGMYDPYTVDTPHDRTYHGMGGKNLQWITHAHFGLPGYFGFWMLLIRALDEYIIHGFTWDLTTAN